MEQPISFTALSVSTSRERELAEQFSTILDTYKLKVEINPPSFVIKSPAAIDVEHDEEGNLVGIGVYDGTHAYYFSTVVPGLPNSLLRLDLIAHNGKGDFDSLRQWGIPVRDSQLIHDVYLIGHIIDSSLKTYGLKDMAARELGIVYPSYEDIVGKRTAKIRRTLDKWPVSVVASYNAMDTFVTFHLYERQLAQCQKL